MNDSVWNNQTQIYQVNKTLRFELKPIGKTLEHISVKGFIDKDDERAKKFLRVKGLLDEYYKDFIERVLDGAEIPYELLEEFVSTYRDAKKNRDDTELRRSIPKIQKKLRDSLYSSVMNSGESQSILKDNVLKNYLPEWLKSHERFEDAQLVEEFSGWTSYFYGFFENRKNVFSKDEISTSIIYRVVHDNLPKFIDNMDRLEQAYSIDELDLNVIDEHLSVETEGFSVRKLSHIESFNEVLSQTGIEKYNMLIGGICLESGRKIQGINELINLRSQQEPDGKRSRSIRKLKLVPLYKQILSDRASFSFRPEPFESDQEVLESLRAFHESVIGNIRELESNLSDISLYDPEQVYVNASRLSWLSKEITGDWSLITAGRENLYVDQKKKEQEYERKKPFISLAEVDRAIGSLNLEEKRSPSTSIEYLRGILRDENGPIRGVIGSLYEDVQKVPSTDGRKLISDKSSGHVGVIKAYLDKVQELYWSLRAFHIDRRDLSSQVELLDVDQGFYSWFEEVVLSLSEITPLYNKVRNYVTQKPFSTDKFKLNFDTQTLLAGWDLNKETDNLSLLFIKEGKYYLGVVDPDHKQVVETIRKHEARSGYEKVEYKLLPTPSRMLPKVVFSKKNKVHFAPPGEIERIRNTASFTKNGAPQEGYPKADFSLEDCHTMIDFYKRCLPMYESWSKFDFVLKETADYQDISEFYADIASQGYSLSLRFVDEAYLESLIEKGALYLFQIYNKDFSPYSKGKRNLHTIYWDMVFDERNRADTIYKLDGGGELFYRRRSIDRRTTHPMNVPIANKDPIEKSESTFAYDLVKDRRYTEDKFFFHVPITMNFKANPKGRFNERINATIRDHITDIKILSIDRGERHLAYYTLLDMNGQILKQGSFNTLKDDVNRDKNYHKKLDALESDRDRARKSWSRIENIREVKSGYLSQLVHAIAQLAVENNAVVVFEDLNFGFKRGRFKIEKQVYQKLEKALIEKLNYLVFKDRDVALPGGALRAYQLTDRFESFKKLGKQSGIMFYVDARNTSKICPRTGFVNRLHPSYENKNQAKEFFSKFDSIKYAPNNDYFEFSFRQSRFRNEGLRHDDWTVCTNGTRLIRKKVSNRWETEEFDPTGSLKKLFESESIEYGSGSDLKDRIQSVDSSIFFKELVFILQKTLQLRNSYTESELRAKPELRESGDYILSCAKSADGTFFDSRTARDTEPQDADANGAYHIGLKGILTLQKMVLSDSNKPSPVTAQEYLDFVQSR